MPSPWSSYDIGRRATRNRRGGQQRAVRRAILAVLRDVLKTAHLYRVMRKMAAENGKAPGIDGVRFDDLSKAEWFQHFRDMRDAILAGTFRPQPLRAVEIAKAGGGTRTLRLAVVGDRVLSKAVADALTPLAERLFLDCSYGFRPRLDRLGLLAALKVFCETHSVWVITADDVRKAFDCIPVDKAVDALRRLQDLGADPALITLAATLIQGHEPKEVGIPQGDPLSPLILNLLLHFALDTMMTAARGGHDPVRYYRYADNLMVVTGTATEGEEALERIRTLLTGVGLEPKGDPGVPRDTADGQTLDLLGVRPTRDGDRLAFDIPNKKWDDLHTKLVEAHWETNPTATAKTLMIGWIEAHAPVHNTDRRGDEEYANRLLNLLRRTRHRHAITRNEIYRVMRTASTRWEKTVTDARTRMTTDSTADPTRTSDTTANATAATPDVERERTDESTGTTVDTDTAQYGTGGTTTGTGTDVATQSSSSRLPRPSGRFTALPDHTLVPLSAPQRARTASSTGIRTRSRSHRHPAGGSPGAARPPPRPPP